MTGRGYRVVLSMGAVAIWGGVWATGCEDCGCELDTEVTPNGNIGVCAAESVSNDDRESATAYTLGEDVEACLQSEDDFDYYSFTVPEEPQGGYVLISVTEGGTDANIGVAVWSAADNVEIQDYYTTTDGGSLYQYFSAAPGADFYFAVSKWATWKDANPYTVNATFVAVPDAYEPNDLRTDASPIELGETVEAYFFAGFENGEGIADESWDDWYSVALNAGAVSIELATNADSVRGEVTLYDSLGEELDSVYGSTKGATVVLDGEVVEAGTHYVQVAPWVDIATEGKGDEVPRHFTVPYSLTVSQD